MLYVAQLSITASHATIQALHGPLWHIVIVPFLDQRGTVPLTALNWTFRAEIASNRSFRTCSVEFKSRLVTSDTRFPPSRGTLVHLRQCEDDSTSLHSYMSISTLYLQPVPAETAHNIVVFPYVFPMKALPWSPPYPRTRFHVVEATCGTHW